MTRISSYGQQQTLLRHIFQQQERIAKAQEQIATGKTHNNFKELGNEAVVNLGSRSLFSKISSYQSTIDAVIGRVQSNDNQLNTIIDSVDRLKQDLVEVIATGEAQGVGSETNATFETLVSALNTKFAGNFLFAGASTGTQPVNVFNIADLQAATAGATPPVTPPVAAADVALAFDNADTAFQARIADGVDVKFGLLAEEIGAETFAILHNIADFNQGPDGPIQGQINATQRAFIEDQIAQLDVAIDNLRQVQTNNGLLFERLDAFAEQHEETSLFVQKFIGEREDIDQAEAITRLNQEFNALELSFQATATLNRITLLDFL